MDVSGFCAIPAIIRFMEFSTSFAFCFRWPIAGSLAVLSFCFSPFVSFKFLPVGFIMSVFIAIESEASFAYVTSTWGRGCFDVIQWDYGGIVRCS